MTDTPRSAGLRRDIDLLDELAAEEAASGRGLGVRRLAERTGRQQSQVSRAMSALCAEGLVEREPGSRNYTLGWRLFSFAVRGADARLVRRAATVLQGLADAVAANAHLCRLHGPEVATLLSGRPGVEHPAVRWDIADVPVTNTSAGRVLLTDHEPSEVACLIGASAGAPDLMTIMRKIRNAKGVGYALVDGEFASELAGASAPVRDFRGVVIAAINVSGPAMRLRSRMDSIGAATAEAATDLSQRLGWCTRNDGVQVV